MVSKEEEIEFSFFSTEKVEPPKVKLLEGKEEKQLVKLTSLAKKLKESMDASGLQSWEISLEGHLEASSGFLPGGSVGFSATLTLSNQS